MSQVAYSQSFVALLHTRYITIAILAITYSKNAKRSIHSALFPELYDMLHYHTWARVLS
jgi:hypothetical protein